MGGRKPTFLLPVESLNMTGAVVDRVTEIAERVAEPMGIEIVEVELKGAGKARLLRIFIDRPEGVTHADCEFISDQVGAVLDAEDVIPGEGYHLEVSSPGVERKLVKPRDFERFVGSKIKVALRTPVDGRGRWEGTLKSFSDGVLVLDRGNGEEMQFTLDQVRQANLKFEW
jgi:ribosome maturation factor RimP